MEKVIVLMSTYNGEKYLRTQIDSLMAQDGVDVEIFARDDGSSDNTINILEEYKRMGKLKINYYSGANMGPAKSFLDLMKHAPTADYYAFCDQDDTWMSDKLKIAVEKIKEATRDCKFKDSIAALEERNKNKEVQYANIDFSECEKTIKSEEPVLYYGMPRFADNSGNLLKGPKGIYEKSLDFPSSLIKCNSTGCTMVFNRRLLEIINDKTPGNITMHDEWLHKVCLALDGQLIYDEDVHILYRQHGDNTVGGQLSLAKVMRRYLKTLFEPDCIRSRCIQTLIECYGEEMSEINLRMCEKVALYKGDFRKRIELILDRNIKTSYTKRNILFKAAVLLGIF